MIHEELSAKLAIHLSSRHSRALLTLFVLTITFVKAAEDGPDSSNPANQLSNLSTSLTQLAERVPGAPRGWETYLAHPLRALSRPDLLVVGISGGTQVGKSTIMNGVAGFPASAIRHTAGATSNSVLVLPPSMGRADVVERLFEGMQVAAATGQDDALARTADHYVFWSTSPCINNRVAVLDGADFDSSNCSNLDKAAEAVRQTDVVIAVLNKSKYSDQRVIEFFRKVRGGASQASKPIIVVINEVKIDRQANQWPDWLAGFLEQTGIDPIAAFLVPDDEDAARNGTLTFHQVAEDRRTIKRVLHLREFVNGLNVGELRMRAHQSAILQALHDSDGAMDFLNTVRQRAARFRSLSASLTSARTQLTWPPLPPQILQDRVMAWWDANHRTTLARWGTKIQSGLSVIPNAAYQALFGKHEPMVRVVEEESIAIAKIVQETIKVLEPIYRRESDLLGGVGEAFFDAGHIAQLTGAIQEQFQQSKEELQGKFGELVLQQCQRLGPVGIEFLQGLDTFVNGAIMPIAHISVGVWTGGLAPTALATPAFASTVVSTSSAAEAAEQLMTGKGLQWFFQSLLEEYRALNINWVLSKLEDQGLRDVRARIEAGTKLDGLPEFLLAENCAQELSRWAKAGSDGTIGSLPADAVPAPTTSSWIPNLNTIPVVGQLFGSP